MPAWKYHPDRNPGKEAEFKSKFQAIQSAQEVLSDPQLRVKYDSERIKVGLHNAYSTPTRPNMPPRTPNTNFPPPPSRPAQPTSNKSAYPTTPSSGTNRYAKYGREGARFASAQEDAKVRTNAFRAWEHMNHAQDPKDSRVPPKPPKIPKEYTYQSGREASNNMPKESTPKMRPGWEQFQQASAGVPNMHRANTTRSPRKQGFAPWTPGGDEPQARNASAYSNMSRGERPNATRPQPQPDIPVAGSTQNMKKPDPLGRFRSRSGDEHTSNGGKERLSTPYATAGGERTYFSSSGLGRSSSTRESQKGKDWNGSPTSNYHSPDSQASSGRHHSASPKMNNARRHRSPSISSTSSEESVLMGDEEAFYASARKSNNEHRARGYDVHREGIHRANHQPFVEPESNEANGMGGTPPNNIPNLSRNTRNAWSQNEEAKRNPAFPNGATNDPSRLSQHLKEREALRDRQGQSKPTDNKASGSSTWRPEVPERPLQKSGSWHEEYQHRGTGIGSDTGEKAGNPPMYENPGLSPSFIYSFRKVPVQRPFNPQKKSQPSSIGTPYWAIPSSVWPKKPIAAPEEPYDPFHWNRHGANQTLNRANKMSNTSFTFPNENHPISDMPPITKEFKSHSSENINTTFSPTDWSGKFTGNATEYFGPVSGKADAATRSRGSPTRGRHTSRPPPQQEEQQQPLGSYPRNLQSDNPPMFSSTMPIQPTSSGRTKFSPDEWNQIFKEQKWAFPPPPPPPQSPNRQATSRRPNPPRKQSRSSNKRPAVSTPASVGATVDDSGEEEVGGGTGSNVESLSSHASGDGSAMDIDPAFTPPGDKPSTAADVTNSNPTETTPKQPSLNPFRPSVESCDKGTRTNQQDGPNLNLDNLKNVAPFASSKDGLKGLDDLSSTLPFESRPAASAQSLAPQRLALPKPPKAPEVPDKLTQSAWERYLAQMRAYMFEWNGYNKKMLAHFNDRQRDVETGLTPDWMSTVGEGGGERGGYGKYMRGVEEDFRVRAHWDVSWEKHRDCLRGLGKVRERLLKSTQVV